MVFAQVMSNLLVRVRSILKMMRVNIKKQTNKQTCAFVQQQKPPTNERQPAEREYLQIMYLMRANIKILYKNSYNLIA